jgi:hypothetical protein
LDAVVIVVRAFTLEDGADNSVAVVGVTADGAALVFNANFDLTFTAGNGRADNVILAFTLFVADGAAMIVFNSGLRTVEAEDFGAHHTGAVYFRNADLAATVKNGLLTIAALDIRAVIRRARVDGAADRAAVIRTLDLLFTFAAFNFGALDARAARNADGAAFARNNGSALGIRASNLRAGGGRAVRAINAFALGATVRVLLVAVGAVQSALGNAVAI